MEENRFFRFVWRFNGLVLMAAGVLAIGVLGFASYKIYKDVRRERTSRNIVKVTENQSVDEKWRLGYLTKIEGSPYLMIPLYSDQSYAQSYYSKSSQSIRNILFIHTETNERKWLYNTNEYLIVNDELLSEKEYNEKNRQIRAILYTVIKEDTNGDKRLTNDDEIVVALSKPGGEGYKEILSGVQVFVGHRFLNKDTMLIVYQKRGIGYSANVELVNFSISNEGELPKLK